jgi:Ca2+-binding RTX toxin-like protein
MSFLRWLQYLRFALAPGRGQSHHRRRGSKRAATQRPSLEVLEDRTLPSFYAPISYSAGSGPDAVVTADFNRDGRLDLAVANAGDNTVSVLLGNANGTFQPAQTSPTGANPRSVAVGDFNGDGKLDVVTANAGDLSVLLGNGDGTLGPPTSLDIGSDPQSVAVGDFNADGKLDLGVTSNVYFPGTPGTPGYWVSTYYGSYYYPGTPGTPGDYEGRANVLLGNGDGSFSAPNSTELGSGYRTSAAVADFNGDTLPDFAAANPDNGTVSVLRGDGAGAFGGWAEFNAGSFPSSVVAGDVNGDGTLDLVTANVSDNVSVLLGSGYGSFGAGQPYAVGRAPDSVAVADFNGDGKPDLVTPNVLSDNVGVLLGNGDGSFRAAQYSAAGQGPNAVAVGDFNGDGRPDLAVADYSAGASVQLNTGDWRSIQLGGFPSPTTAGQAHTLTVTALESNGSVMTGYTGTAHFTSSDPQAGLPADYTFTAADNGTHTFTVTLKTAGTQSITVADTGPTAFSDTQGGIAVNSAAAAMFQVGGFPSPVSVGDSGGFAVTAYDACGNLASNYTGTVHFTSSDGHASLPADYTFTAYNYGTAYFSAILNTAGPQSLTVSDVANSAATGSQTGIHVNPLATVTGPDGGLRNQTLTFTLGATSGRPANTVFTYAIDWNGDGVVDQTVTGPSGTTVNHSYANSGTYVVGVTATVHLGADDYTSYVTYHSLHIFAVTATVQADPGDATRSALVVQGTADADSLVLSPGAGNEIALSASGYSVGSFSAPGGAAFAHLLVYGNGGADTIRLAGNLSVPAFLFGGDGNDTLDASGSTANNLLVGGAGNETLYGGSGRDLLIGGLGADILRAGSGGALLIGGYTDYDANVPALLALMKEWSRTDVGYNTRVKHLNGTLGGGLNGSYRLTRTAVHDDSAIDYLYGGAGLDWYFVSGHDRKKDKVVGQTSGEVVSNA